MQFWKKNIDLDVFDDVWKKLKHRAHDAYSDVFQTIKKYIGKQRVNF